MHNYACMVGACLATNHNNSKPQECASPQIMVLGWEVDLETPQHISEQNSAIAFSRRNRDICYAIMCMHAYGRGLLGNHHNNSKPQRCSSPQLCPRANWARRRTCTMLLQRPLPPTHTKLQMRHNHWHANKNVACLLTTQLHDTAPVPYRACSFAEFAHKSFQVKRVCNRNTDRLVCKCTD